MSEDTVQLLTSEQIGALENERLLNTVFRVYRLEGHGKFALLVFRCEIARKGQDVYGPFLKHQHKYVCYRNARGKKRTTLLHTLLPKYSEYARDNMINSDVHAPLYDIKATQVAMFEYAHESTFYNIAAQTCLFVKKYIHDKANWGECTPVRLHCGTDVKLEELFERDHPDLWIGYDRRIEPHKSDFRFKFPSEFMRFNIVYEEAPAEEAPAPSQADEQTSK